MRSIVYLLTALNFQVQFIFLIKGYLTPKIYLQPETNWNIDLKLFRVVCYELKWGVVYLVTERIFYIILEFWNNKIINNHFDIWILD